MTTDERKVGVFSFIFQIFKLQRRSIGLIAVVFLCITVTVVYELFYPYSMKILVDSALVTKDTSQVILILSIFALGYLAILAANIIEMRVVSLLSVKLSGEIRLKIMNGLLRIEPRDEQFENKILTHLNDDVRHLESSVGPIWRTIKFIMTLIYGSILLISFDFHLFLVTAALLPFTLFAPNFYSSKIPADTKVWRDAQAQIFASAKEARSMQNVIHVLRLRIANLLKFKKITRFASNASRQYLLRNLMVGRSGFFSIEFIKLTVLGIGAYLVLTDVLTVGGLVGFLALLAILNNSLAGIIGYQSILIQGNDALNTIKSLLKKIPRRNPRPIHELGSLEDSLVFDSVGLKLGETQILSNINLSIPKGHSVAFVGPSGAGKSSALKLLLKQFDASSGKILFDKHALSEVEESQYFPKVGVVFQEPKLFEGTLRENLVAANKNASEEDLIRAVKKADIYHEIMAFKDGFDTFLRGDSSILSGGQKQRIAIARALINNPEILYLDEASSALDPFTDASIGETFSKMRGAATIISVTHHLETIKDFDNIIVFNKGRIEETGNHSQLMKKKGLYSELWNKQNGVGIDRDNKTFSIKPDWLRFVPIFQNLDDDTLAKISKELVMERFDADKIIFSEGDSGSKMYIVATGIIEISVPDGEGSETRAPLAKFTTGDFFGEIALLLNEARTATATTKSVCLLLTLTRNQLDKILDSLPLDTKENILSIAKDRIKTNPFFQKT